MLSKRLLKLANNVKAKRVIDIGSDHAKLPIYLLLENKIDEAIITDININPLIGAINNVKKNGLMQKSKFVLHSGLDFCITDANTDIIIAGMGGIEIVQILKNLKNPYQQLILQANNNIEILRSFLQENNYKITIDEIVKDVKFYNYIVVNHDGRVYTDDEIILGRGQSIDYKNYLEYEIDKLETLNLAKFENKLNLFKKRFNEIK